MNKVLAVNLHKAFKQVKITQVSDSPILNHAKFEFSNGWLVITTADLQKSYQTQCPCILDEEWATGVLMVHEITACFGVNNRKKSTRKFYPFFDFISLAAQYEDVLEFTFDPALQIMKVKVQGERSTTTFKCLDIQEFPAVKE